MRAFDGMLACAASAALGCPGGGGGPISGAADRFPATCEGSLALAFPSEAARAAAGSVEIYAYSTFAVGVGTARLTCVDLMGHLGQGEPPQGDPVAVLSDAFDCTAPELPDSDEGLIVHAVAYNGQGGRDMKPLFEGCVRMTSDRAAILLEPIIPYDQFILVAGGDRQRVRLGGALSEPLRARSMAALPPRTRPYALPAVEMIFEPPPGVRLAERGDGEPLRVLSDARGEASVTAVIERLVAPTSTVTITVRSDALENATPLSMFVHVDL